MGLQKVAFNFMVERGGKLAKSLLCHSKPPKVPINIKELKYAPTLEKDTMQLSQAVGKHKIPRYLYHITSKENYNKIIQSGGITPLEADSFCGTGIFMLELENFFKNWQKIKVREQPLIKTLLGQAAHGTKDIVILRIPTSNISTKNLFIRDQKIFFNWHTPELTTEANTIYEKLVSKEKNTTSGFVKFTKLFELKEQARKIWFEKFASFTTKLHMQGKTHASQSNLFKQRNSPIEYIYRKRIPAQNIELLGEAHCDIKPASSMQEVINIYQQLLKNTSELNHIRYLSN